MSSRGKRWYMIAYDVRDEKRLRRTAKHLEGYGIRLQYSIFRCKLTDREVERLRWELQKILEQEDSLLIIGLCDTCASRAVKRSENVEWTLDSPNFEII